METRETVPVEVLLKILSYVPTARDLCVCSCVCKQWRDVVEHESVLWEQLLATQTPQAFRDDPLLNPLDGAKAKLVAFMCAWSDEDHSKNLFLKPNRLTVHRNPVAQSTDAVRGKKGFTGGEHYWTVTWHGPKFGSNAVVGVATEDSSLQGNGYYSLLGEDEHSWGWDVSENTAQHSQSACSYPTSSDRKVQIGQRVGVILDMDRGTLAFDIDGCYLGVAFSGLPRLRLFPAVSAVYGNSEVSLLYHGLPIAG